jgi:hypothetical protein
MKFALYLFRWPVKGNSIAYRIIFLKGALRPYSFFLKTGNRFENASPIAVSILLFGNIARITLYSSINPIQFSLMSSISHWFV